MTLSVQEHKDLYTCRFKWDVALDMNLPPICCVTGTEAVLLERVYKGNVSGATILSLHMPFSIEGLLLHKKTKRWRTRLAELLLSLWSVPLIGFLLMIYGLLPAVIVYPFCLCVDYKYKNPVVRVKRKGSTLYFSCPSKEFIDQLVELNPSEVSPCPPEKNI